MTKQILTQIDEIEKIARLKDGCTTTFQQVYHLYREQIYAYSLKKTKSEEHAKEISQLTFIKLWRYRSNLSQEVSLDHQLFRITRTCMIDFLRTKAHERTIKISLTNNLPVKIIDPPPAFSKLAYDDLIKQLDKLPPTRKRVFYMSKVEGYSNKEIAGAMNISVKTVEDHMTKALKKLRSSIVFFLFFCIF